MRFNRGTIIFLLACVVVIVGVLILGNPAEAPAPSPTPDNVGGQVFPELAGATENVVRFEIRELSAPEDENLATPAPVSEATEEPAPEPDVLVLEKDDEDFWDITEAPVGLETDRGTDQVMVVGVIDIFAGLAYDSRFELGEANADDFGLGDNQGTLLTATRDDDSTYSLRVGGRNPGGNRYYAFINDDNSMVYAIPSDLLANIIDWLNAPPYVPAPTSTPTLEPTLNPLSEVQQATATAMSDMTATAQMEEIMAILEGTPEVTEEADAEETPEATEEE